MHPTNTKEVRLHNAQLLQKSVGGQKGMIEKTGRSQSQLSALMGEKAYKAIGEKIARSLEKDFSLPIGWLDTWHDSIDDTAEESSIREETAQYRLSPLEEIIRARSDDTETLRYVLQSVKEITEEEEITLTSEQFARVVLACLYSSITKDEKSKVESSSIMTAIHAVI